jgi:hypothetical protein
LLFFLSLWLVQTEFRFTLRSCVFAVESLSNESRSQLKGGSTDQRRLIRGEDVDQKINSFLIFPSSQKNHILNGSD